MLSSASKSAPSPRAVEDEGSQRSTCLDLLSGSQQTGAATAVIQPDQQDHGVTVAKENKGCQTCCNVKAWQRHKGLFCDRLMFLINQASPHPPKQQTTKQTNTKPPKTLDRWDCVGA